MKKTILSIGIILSLSVLSINGQPVKTVKVTTENDVRGSAKVMDLSLTSDRPIKVACVGNSITYGHGVEDGANNSYPAQLGKMLGSGFNVSNFGYSGAYLLTNAESGWAYIQKDQYIPSKNFAPDVVIIKLGSNDTKPHAWAHIADFDKDYKALIKSYRDLPSKPKVILSYPFAVFGAGNFGITENNLLLMLPMIQKVADDEGCEIIDFHSATVGHPELVYDLVHPNAKGCAVMAQLANYRFREILAKKSEVTSDKPITVLASPKEGYEFVEWSDGTNTYTKNPYTYIGSQSIELVAKFRRIGSSYCIPWGTTENSRYLKKLWAEIDGQRVDLIGTESTDNNTHPKKVVLDRSDAAIVVSPGQAFKIKSISNNSTLSSVDPIRRAVVFPFVDWNRDLEFGERSSNEALPMIGRAENDSNDTDALAVVSLDQTIEVPTDAVVGRTILRLCFTDGFSSTAGLNQLQPTHTACSPIEKGMVVDIVLQIVPSDGNFTFDFSSGEKGSVEADKVAGTYSAGTAIRLIAVPESNHVEFVSWTDQHGEVISTRSDFVYYVAQDIVLKATFKDRSYPVLTHWFANTTQSNRFLNKVMTKVFAGETTTVFDLGSSPTKIPVNKDLKGGSAIASYLEPMIRLPKGRTSFTLTCFSTHNVVEGLNNELGWTNQAVLIDWNQNYSFAEANEQTAPTTYGGANTVNHAFGNAAGFSRTILIPTKQPEGIYRMYVVYGEPTSTSPSWPITMIDEGDIRMGNVYEFNISIEDASSIDEPNDGKAKLITNELGYVLTQMASGSHLKIINVMGQIILDQQIESTSHTFNLSAKGIYILKIESPDKQIQSIRLIR